MSCRHQFADKRLKHVSQTSSSWFTGKYFKETERYGGYGRTHARMHGLHVCVGTNMVTLIFTDEIMPGDKTKDVRPAKRRKKSTRQKKKEITPGEIPASVERNMTPNEKALIEKTK